MHRILVFFMLLFAALLPLGTSTAQASESLRIGEPTPWALGLQPGVTPVKEKIGAFHDELLIIIFGISGLVLVLMVYIVIRFNKKRNPVASKTTHNVPLEIIWTALPVVLLIIILVPSLRLLYFSDKDPAAEMTVKVVGHQWYWSYEFPDHGGFSYDSYMIPDKEIDVSKGQVRLLDVDNTLVIPVDTSVRFIVTAADVIHSFFIPAFGLQKAAIPGRLNETWAKVEREGRYYGQCNKICGNGHAFMPVAVDVVSKEKFAAWIKEKGGTMPAPKPAAALPAPVKTVE